MAASVIDTGDWPLVVPLRTPMNLTGSRLIATMTASFGGPPAVAIDSAAGSITWSADPSTGLTSSLLVKVPAAARGDWLAIGPSGRPAPVTLFFDVKRGVGGASAGEVLGRSSLLVYPATDSAAVLALAGGLQPVLTPICGAGVVLPALQTGPQGPPGTGAGQAVPVFTAATILSGHMAVRALGDGTVAYASADQPAQAGAVMGITVSAAQAGAQVSVATEGPVDEPSWSWSAGSVWLGLNGALTQTPPISGVALRIGVALTPTRLLVSLAPPILL